MTKYERDELWLKKLDEAEKTGSGEFTESEIRFFRAKIAYERKFKEETPAMLWCPREEEYVEMLERCVKDGKPYPKPPKGAKI